jgi:hypothetical protein
VSDEASHVFKGKRDEHPARLWPLLTWKILRWSLEYWHSPSLCSHGVWFSRHQLVVSYAHTSRVGPWWNVWATEGPVPGKETAICCLLLQGFPSQFVPVTYFFSLCGRVGHSDTTQSLTALPFPTSLISNARIWKKKKPRSSSSDLADPGTRQIILCCRVGRWAAVLDSVH